MSNGQINRAPRPYSWSLVGLFVICVSAVGFVWELGKSAGKALQDAVSRPSVPRSNVAVSEEQGRASDQRRQPGGKGRLREAWGTMLVACSLMAALAGGVGFLVVYWNFGSNRLLGATLAVFWGGLGLALVLHARWLMPREEAIETREPAASPPAERAFAAEEFHAGAGEIRRRGLLAALAVTAGGVLTGMIVSLFRSLGTSPDPSLLSTIWKRGQPLTTAEGKTVSVDMLEPGSTVVVFPGDRIGDERAQTVLIRVDEGHLQLPDSRANWAPMGYVAYSRVCTHAGCPVGLYEKTTEMLMCPCHQSTFDVLRGARPTGGPAARALPQLPLYADRDGILRAAGGFTQPPGPGFWGMPS